MYMVIRNLFNSTCIMEEYLFQYILALVFFHYSGQTIGGKFGGNLGERSINFCPRLLVFLHFQKETSINAYAFLLIFYKIQDCILPETVPTSTNWVLEVMLCRSELERQVKEYRLANGQTNGIESIEIMWILQKISEGV